jgi:two-component system sensor histidine kinase KdpD
VPPSGSIIHDLERIPSREVKRVPSLDALLRRRPSVCLVDGLATTTPDARHAKRYQDVGEMLEAGISVLTTIGLEYIAEQQDFVRQVVGHAPVQSVPQEFVSRADELVVVDAPPEAGADADTADEMNALRQRALLLAARRPTTRGHCGVRRPLVLELPADPLHDAQARRADARCR